ncbi:MAG TPA: response regulator [Polyangia bacterium]|jgi:CheY-like chemotaxis protein|nr:response regulator [Polyangia bacterium]
MPTKTSSAGPGSTLPPRRPAVLIVEDDRDVALTINDVVEDSGYRALCASNGREALSLLEVEVPALMLIDLFMPEMNGVELLKVIKKSPKLASIPRVIMTAANDQMIGVREEVTVLYKPVDFDALTRLLQRYCEPAESARFQ